MSESEEEKDAKRDADQQRREHVQLIRASISQQKQSQELYLEQTKMNAQLLAARYHALVEYGLTADEALAVVCRRGWLSC
jgi:hypothetical protein